MDSGIVLGGPPRSEQELQVPEQQNAGLQAISPLKHRCQLHLRGCRGVGTEAHTVHLHTHTDTDNAGRCISDDQTENFLSTNVGIEILTCYLEHVEVKPAARCSDCCYLSTSCRTVNEDGAAIQGAATTRHHNDITHRVSL